MKGVAAIVCFLINLQVIDSTRQGQRMKTHSQGSAVQKIIEMLGEMKTKLKADLAEETKAMNEFMAFCDDEAKNKQYAIKTATRALEDLNAVITESDAKIAECSDEITTLGTEISEKEKELAGATKIRKAEHADFVTTEKELAKSADEVSRALAEVKKNQAALMQLPSSRRHAQLKRVEAYAETLSKVVESALLTGHQRHALRNFMQISSGDRDESDLSLTNAEKFFGKQPQPKGYQSATGGIVDILEETKDKAENELGDCRKAEMEASHKYEMLKGSLEGEIGNKKRKLADASSGKTAAEEAKGKAEAEKVDTEKSKAADEEYLQTLRTDCQAKAVEWEERLKSAKGEMGALDKAKEILSEGVKALIQVSSKSKRVASRAALQEDSDDEDDDGASNADSDVRQKVLDRLQDLQGNFHSYALAQLASRVKSGDPMAKVKGLIEEMIAKLMDELNKEVGQKAFCDEEMGKSKKALEEKGLKLSKFKTRLDEAETAKMELTEAVKELEGEIGEIDKAQAEATKIRTEEHTEFKKAQADYKSSEDACAQAIEVLKEYYGGESFIQMKVQTRVKSEAEVEDQSGSSNDSGSMIISFLETAQSDFAALLAEVQASEGEAKKAYDSLTTENKVAKASKQATIKSNMSQIKMLTTNIEDTSEDHADTSKELDAVNAYIDKLKPECESKAMSASEKIAARKQEIEGLKEALSILSGAGAAFLQTGHRVRRIHLH
jgi:hypothetical protein